MKDDLPNDSDGDALRRLRSDGSDLSKPMEIEFHVDVPNHAAGAEFAKVAETHDFRTRVCQDQESQAWTCWCTVIMLPSYVSVIEAQRLLDEIGRPYGAKSDGWGSFGNNPDYSPNSQPARQEGNL